MLSFKEVAKEGSMLFDILMQSCPTYANDHENEDVRIKIYHAYLDLHCEMMKVTYTISRNEEGDATAFNIMSWTAEFGQIDEYKLKQPDFKHGCSCPVAEWMGQS